MAKSIIVSLFILGLCPDEASNFLSFRRFGSPPYLGCRRRLASKLKRLSFILLWQVTSFRESKDFLKTNTSDCCRWSSIIITFTSCNCYLYSRENWSVSYSALRYARPGQDYQDILDKKNSILIEIIYRPLSYRFVI